MNIGKKCPIDKIDWVDENDHNQTLELFFQEGPNKGKSKGLRHISEELGLNVDSKTSLTQLRKNMSEHKAFESQTKLEILAKKYNIKIFFVNSFL